MKKIDIEVFFKKINHLTVVQFVYKLSSIIWDKRCLKEVKEYMIYGSRGI